MARKTALRKLRSFWTTRDSKFRKDAAGCNVHTVETAEDVHAVAFLKDNASSNGSIHFGKRINNAAGFWVKYYGLQLIGPTAEEVIARFAPRSAPDSQPEDKDARTMSQPQEMEDATRKCQAQEIEDLYLRLGRRSKGRRKS